MQSRKQKFVVKCGRFAVLVDLYILPQGGHDSGAWFSQQNRKEEVGALIKDAVEQKVRQCQTKQRKEFSPDSPMCIKGQNLRLAAYFMKRHVNLRCVIRQHYQELRVFPERFVVCVSLPEFEATPFGNLNMDSMEQSGQSSSGYFPGPRETLDPLNSSIKTKRAALQKIARQANTHPAIEPEHEIQDQNLEAALSQLPSVAVEAALQGKGTVKVDVADLSMQRASVADEAGNKGCQTEKVRQLEAEDCTEQRDLDNDSESIPQDHQRTGRRRRRVSGRPTEDFDHQEAKRPCIREPFMCAKTPCGSTMVLTQNSTPGPSPSHPGATAQASSEGMLEEELLTHGKQGPHLPLSNSTAKHTNQSRLAASLRGLSVKAVSSGSSISSRSAAKEEEKSVPRISRLRRLKKS